MSPLRSSAGPAVCTNGTPSSAATIWASEVLPRPGGPASSRWSRASPRALHASIATVSCSRSVSCPTKSCSRRGRSERSSSSSASRYGVWMRAAVSPACAPTRVVPFRVLIGSRSAPRQAQRLADQLLGAVAGGVAQELVNLARRIPELEQAFAGEHARVLALAPPGHDRRARAGGRPALHAHLLAQLDDDPFGRALADPRHGLKAGRVARGERGDQLARRPRREHPERDLGPDGLDGEQHQEQLALLL